MKTSDPSEGDSRDPKTLLKWQSVDNSLFVLDENTLMVCAETVHLPFILIILASATASGM